MLLVAQRVVSCARPIQGVNAYRYSHDPACRPADPRDLFEDPTRKVERTDVELPPPGNRVVSFLDVAAPEGTSREEILKSLTDFAQQGIAADIPIERVLGSCAVRFSLDRRLVPVWRQEFDDLTRRISAI